MLFYIARTIYHDVVLSETCLMELYVLLIAQLFVVQRLIRFCLASFCRYGGRGKKCSAQNLEQTHPSGHLMEMWHDNNRRYNVYNEGVYEVW